MWNFAFGNRPKQHRSHPAMPPQCPATPRTADIWLPKATDSTSALKTLAAPQSSSSNGASVASHAQDPAMAPPWPAKPKTAVLRLPKATDGTSALKTLATPQPAQSSSSNGASVASQAQDSTVLPKAMDGTSAFKTLAAPESDGWHLGLENPRRASAGPVFVPESDGLENPRRASAGPVFVRNGASVASQAQDSSSMASESDGWHLGLENPRRASAGPVFVQQRRLRGQPSPGQQFYGFRKRRMAPRPRKRRMAPRP